MKDFLIEIFAHPWNIFPYKTKTAIEPNFCLRLFPMPSTTCLEEPI